MVFRLNMLQLLWIFIGGGCGAAARHALIGLCTRHTALQTPWAILIANLLGCLAIGLAAEPLLRAHNPLWRLLMISGFLGGFTTYSTFILDLLTLSSRHASAALLYGALHLIGGIACCLLGLWLAKTFIL